MIFSRINLREELSRERDIQDNLLVQANAFLSEAASTEKEIFRRLLQSERSSRTPALGSAELGNIFSLDQIRKVCIRYRLRFLDTSHFRSGFPYEAIARIKSIEKKYGVVLDSFRIMAPAESFDLENINKDPLLFAQLNDGTYLLIHKWGHDLAWYRRILTWPLQNLKTLVLSLAVLCLMFSLCLPASVMHVFNFQSEFYLRTWLTIHTFIGLFGICLWLGISFNKNFSSLNWESKYYNY